MNEYSKLRRKEKKERIFKVRIRGNTLVVRAPSQPRQASGCPSQQGGVGEALAREFHKRGKRVIATARDVSKMEHLKGLGIQTLALDVTSRESIDSAVKEVSSLTGGNLNVLVNNSGGCYGMPLMDVDVNEARKLFDVNVLSLIAMTQAFLPLLRAAHGTVVNHGSAAGHFPYPMMGMYCASKAAAESVSDVMRVELAPFGIKVITLTSGGLRTKIYEKQPPATLPENSLYLPVKEKVEIAMIGENTSSQMDIDVFAKKVVGDLLKSHPSPALWRGAGASLIWFVVTFIPRTALDGIKTKLWGLSGLYLNQK